MESIPVSRKESSILNEKKVTEDEKINLGNGLSNDALDFVDCFRFMTQKNEHGTQLRVQQWNQADSNGSGLVSLAEADMWVKGILMSKCVEGTGERIWSRYRRCFIHAFKRAKDVTDKTEIEGINATSDDYVEKKEFRLLIGYLCVYVVMFDAFQLIDGGTAGIDENDDNRIELDEWLAGYQKVADHSLSGLKDIEDPKILFSEMDKDGGGMVLLGEWCHYLAAKEVESHTLLGQFLQISIDTKSHTHKKGSPLKSVINAKKNIKGRNTAIKPASKFTGQVSLKLGKGVSDDALDFFDCFQAMTQRNDAGRQFRIRQWQHADSNRNGLISLAECDQWVKDVLISKCNKGEGRRIWSRYRRCFMHAFNRAKDVTEKAEIEGINATSDDYVEKKEFRLLIGYLCVYVVMFDAFQLIDGGTAGIDENDDFRVELDEWLAGYQKVAEHSLSGLKDIEDPKIVFSEMDKDGGGMVLLGEWCRYLASKEVEYETLFGQFLRIKSDVARANTPHNE